MRKYLYFISAMCAIFWSGLSIAVTTSGCYQGETAAKTACGGSSCYYGTHSDCNVYQCKSPVSSIQYFANPSNPSHLYCFTNSTSQCPAGEVSDNHLCHEACTGGKTWNGSACACPAGQEVYNGNCVVACQSGYERNPSTGVCQIINFCANKQGQVKQLTICHGNSAGCSGGCVVSSFAPKDGDIGIKLKGDDCFTSEYLGTYTGDMCDSNIPSEKPPVEPISPITNTSDQYCVDGQCVNKTPCGETDKQVCSETPTGGLLCYTVGKCSNTEAPPVPDAPYNPYTGKDSEGGDLGSEDADQKTQEPPTGGNGGGSGSWTAPGSIAPPGLSTDPGEGDGDTSNGGGGTTEQGQYCDEHPDAFACSTLDKPVDDNEIGTETRTLTLNKERTATGQCPAPITVNYMGKNITVSYDYLCTMATMSRPIVLLIGSLLATVFVFSIAMRAS